MINPQMLSLLVLVPMATGPLQTVTTTDDESGQISLRLCGGGSLLIPLAGDDDNTPDGPQHMMTAACHGVLRFGELDGDGDADESDDNAL